MTKFLMPYAVMNLHLFDGGASSASGTASGAESGTNSIADGTQSAQGENNTQQDASAIKGDVVVTSPDDEARTQFENYIKGEGKQYFDERVQKIINNRFKQTKTLEENAKLLEPALKTLASVYGIDAKDLKGLSQAILDDNRMYEEKATQNGVSVEVQKKFDRMQLENEQLKATEKQKEQEERTRQILEDWHNQADELKKEFPEFDLDSALDTSKDFYDLIVRGIPVRNAYIAAFPDEYGRKIEKSITDNIKSRGMRPNENSVSSSSAATSSFDVHKLTPAQRRELANRANRGETITFR